jgi:hypothetical protein
MTRYKWGKPHIRRDTLLVLFREQQDLPAALEALAGTAAMLPGQWGPPKVMAPKEKAGCGARGFCPQCENYGIVFQGRL